MTATPELHPIHASLYRPVLLVGAEPAIVIVEVTTAFALLFGVGLHVATVVLAAFYLTVVHSTMVGIAKEDAQMSALYIRSLGAGDFYFPNARLHAATPAARPALPPAH